VEKQLAAAEAKLDVLKRADEAAGPDNREAAQGQLLVAQAEATVDILKMILTIK
jgi:hypothetical protein